MLIGYARTSTVDQDAGLEAQLKELEALNCDKVFHEKVSSVQTRKKLDAALDYLRDGDTLVVTKMDRLARSMFHLLEIAKIIEDKGAFLKIISPEMDTSTSHGKLVFNIFGSVAQFEREVMLERQREGIAKAKAEGKYKGRKPTAQAKAEDVIRLKDAGIKPTDIAKKLGIGRASVYRILQAQAA